MCLFLCLVNLFEGFILSQNEFVFNEKRNALVFILVNWPQDDLNLFEKWFVIRNFISLYGVSCNIVFSGENVPCQIVKLLWFRGVWSRSALPVVR